jgi:hypothetical protein
MGSLLGPAAISDEAGRHHNAGFSTTLARGQPIVDLLLPFIFSWLGGRSGHDRGPVSEIFDNPVKPFGRL